MTTERSNPLSMGWLFASYFSSLTPEQTGGDTIVNQPDYDILCLRSTALVSALTQVVARFRSARSLAGHHILRSTEIGN